MPVDILKLNVEHDAVVCVPLLLDVQSESNIERSTSRRESEGAVECSLSTIESLLHAERALGRKPISRIAQENRESCFSTIPAVASTGGKHKRGSSASLVVLESH